MIKRFRKLQEEQAKLLMYFEFLEATVTFLLPFYSIDIQKQIKDKLINQLALMRKGVSLELLQAIDPDQEINWITRIRRLIL